MSRTATLFIALIRTHHITNRKKLQRVKKAAEQYAVPFVLIRSGGSPGIMYAEGPNERNVADWVSAVQGLRYKDFQCPQKPSSHSVKIDEGMRDSGFTEVASVTEFGETMSQKGLTTWWKIGMGYEASDR